MSSKRDKITRFKSGRFSFNDYLSVASYFKNESLDDELKQLLKEDWEKAGGEGMSHEELELLLDQLHDQIQPEETSVVSRWNRFRAQFARAAVWLLLPALLFGATLSYLGIKFYDDADSWAEIHSPIGARTKFHLPDGTEGWLNGGAVVKYPLDFKKREVEVSGEVWFDVVHDERKKFWVKTPFFDVEVLGTRFNVVAYDYEKTAEVILEHGRVKVLCQASNSEIDLMPDQQLIYNKQTRKMEKKNIDSKAYTSWKDGLLIFRNVPMAELAKRLERKYNTEIVLHGDKLKALIFRATFQDESLEEICSMLASVAPIRYQVHKRASQFDGTFDRGRVEIWLRE